MKTPQGQFLIFTGLDGAILNPSPEGMQEVLPALELLRSRDIPLIAVSSATAAQMLPMLRSLDIVDPFIVEGGAAIYIPQDALKIDFKFQKKMEQYKVVILGASHDEGDAVRFLTQLYREEHQDQSVISIGLSDGRHNGSMLYAVDIPVLVRRPDGRFDDEVGRFGMKFTRQPGPVGWNQAVIALITEDAEA